MSYKRFYLGYKKKNCQNIIYASENKDKIKDYTLISETFLPIAEEYLRFGSRTEKGIEIIPTDEITRIIFKNGFKRDLPQEYKINISFYQGTDKSRRNRQTVIIAANSNENIKGKEVPGIEDIVAGECLIKDKEIPLQLLNIINRNINNYPKLTHPSIQYI